MARRVWKKVFRVGHKRHLVHSSPGLGYCFGVRYDNPARTKEVKRARVRRKELKLPEPDQFVALVKEVRVRAEAARVGAPDAAQRQSPKTR